MDVPCLRTGRLLLRAFARADFEAYAAIWADAAVTAQVGVPARSRAEAWRAFLAMAGHWPMEGFGQWAICDPDGVYLGQTGFFRAMRGFGAGFDGWPEAGWVLGRDAQGRGIGAEAAVAAHHWFDQVIGGRSVAIISPGNAASLRVAARLGYAVTGTRADPDGPLVLLARG